MFVRFAMSALVLSVVLVGCSARRGPPTQVAPDGEFTATTRTAPGSTVIGSTGGPRPPTMVLVKISRERALEIALAEVANEWSITDHEDGLFLGVL